ncbi:MAG: VOC family protein, partial [Alphaproteobacteria bacterium]|nr:VOC family protein [Alphaproteobacteria bacterium]
MRLTGAMLFVRDLAAMTAFYRDVMGLTVDEATRTDRWVAFHAGPEGGGMGAGAALSLHAIPPEIAATFEIATPAEAREDAACKLLFAVEDMAATLARL